MSRKTKKWLKRICGIFLLFLMGIIIFFLGSFLKLNKEEYRQGKIVFRDNSVTVVWNEEYADYVYNYSYLINSETGEKIKKEYFQFDEKFEELVKFTYGEFTIEYVNKPGLELTFVYMKENMAEYNYFFDNSESNLLVKNYENDITFTLLTPYKDYVRYCIDVASITANGKVYDDWTYKGEKRVWKIQRDGREVDYIELCFTLEDLPDADFYEVNILNTYRFNIYKIDMDE